MTIYLLYSVQKLVLKKLLLKENRGWSGGVMALGSFQSRGVLLVWIIVWQGPSVLSAGAMGVVWIDFLSPVISLTGIQPNRE